MQANGDKQDCSKTEYGHEFLNSFESNLQNNLYVQNLKKSIVKTEHKIKDWWKLDVYSTALEFWRNVSDNHDMPFLRELKRTLQKRQTLPEIWDKMAVARAH